MVAVYPVSDDSIRMCILQLTHRPPGLRTRIGLCARTYPISFFPHCHFISDQFHINHLQHLRTRESVRAINAPFFHMHETRMADCFPLFDRYSNTLLVSLNNRISIRETYGARCAVEVGAYPSSSGRSETTEDFLILESEKHQKQTMKHTPTEVKVMSQGVISKSRDLRFTGFFSCPEKSTRL